LKNPERLDPTLTGKDVYILAWTTTPWTLPGNVALAVGEDINYVIAMIAGSNFILAKERLAEVMKSTEHSIVKEMKGKTLLNLEYEPLFDVQAPEKENAKGYYVVAGDFVTTEDGTGIVHIAPSYGEDDYKLGLKYNLPVISTLDEKGHFTKTVPQLEGQYFKKANNSVIEDLEHREILFSKQAITHSYPHCHRCETALYYNAIPAWFINIDKIRKRMLDLNEKINWYPENLKLGRFAKGIEQAPDWNISRNRYFATPMPIWRCAGCGELEVIGSIEELKQKSDAKEVTDIHNHRIDHLAWQCGKCGPSTHSTGSGQASSGQAGEMKRIKEVFDCWVESGSMPFAQMHYPFENKEKFEANFPAQFISEYISQTRAWFYVTHVLSSALFDNNAFENVVTTGVILNEKGEKMSKSKKNYPDPNKVIDEYGADALRYYLMSSSVMHADNLFFNETEVRDVFRKINMIIWNVYKFYEMYADQRGFEADQRGSENILDKWIIVRLNQLIEEVTKQMNGYDLPRSVRPISDFINDFSTWYLRRSRDRFKSDNETDKQAALATTKYVLIELSKAMAPFMPFMAESLWQRVTGNNFKDENRSVHLEAWPVAHNVEHVTHNKILEEMSIARTSAAEGLSARDAAGIKIRQALPFYESPLAKDLSEELAQLIKEEVNVLRYAYGSEKKLGTELTEELKLDGVRRELVRSINNLRKNAGLTIADRVVIYWSIDEADSAEPLAKQVFEKFGEAIKKDTLSDSIVQERKEEVDLKKEVKVNGETVWFGIKKI
jgi:isoleucyl-tRNA synthetase